MSEVSHAVQPISEATIEQIAAARPELLGDPGGKQIAHGGISEKGVAEVLNQGIQGTDRSYVAAFLRPFSEAPDRREQLVQTALEMQGVSAEMAERIDEPFARGGVDAAKQVAHGHTESRIAQLESDLSQLSGRAQRAPQTESAGPLEQVRDRLGGSIVPAAGAVAAIVVGVLAASAVGGAG